MMKKVLAFDIGGTKIAYAIIDESGNFINEIIKVTTPKTSNGIYELLKTVIKGSEDEIDGVAIATAGAINNENNKIISHVGNLPEKYNELDFTSLTSKPIFLENDANAAGWAEFKLGSAKGTQNAVVLTLGTGVGSGIIVNGKLLKGKSGSAGEMHVRFGFGHNRKCTCGLWDCLETYVSGNALTTDAQIYMSPDATSYDVIRGLKENNQKAQAAFDHWQECLENALVMVCNLFDPEVVVLSGSMAQFVEYDKLQKEVNQDILTQPTELKLAKFENNAGMLGVALLLLERLK
ncbi:MAG: ROK family protein [Alphaproteobacteria bacterium]|nr:ROK family protein [Alphaproteobacteria bacterium]